MIRKFYSDGTMQTLADRRQVKITCSSASVDLEGEIIDQAGVDLTRFRMNPVVLWGHNPNMPIARAMNIELENGRLVAMVQFPPSGISERSDEVFGLVSCGVVNGISIGFLPVKSVPLDQGNPKKGPQRYQQSMLLEISFVSLPANPDALVSARSMPADASRAARQRAVEVLKLAHPPADQALQRRQRQVEVLRLGGGQ